MPVKSRLRKPHRIQWNGHGRSSGAYYLRRLMREYEEAVTSLEEAKQKGNADDVAFWQELVEWIGPFLEKFKERARSVGIVFPEDV